MKVKDLIDKMSDDTEILIYSVAEDCSMPIDGECEGGTASYYDCLDCSSYASESNEYTKFNGKAIECPIKLSNLTVMGINNAHHNMNVYAGRNKWRASERRVIAIKVKD